MANRTVYPLETVKNEVHLLTAKLTGGGAASDLVNADSANMGGGEISAAVYAASTGVFNLTFRKKYPQGLVPFPPGIVGTTTGLVAIYTAWDPAAGTATIKFSVGSVATDPATTDSIRLAFLVRNSSQNS